LTAERALQPGVAGTPDTPLGTYWKKAEVVWASILPWMGPIAGERIATGCAAGSSWGIGPRDHASDSVALLGTSESCTPSTKRMLALRVVPATFSGCRYKNSAWLWLSCTSKRVWKIDRPTHKSVGVALGASSEGSVCRISAAC